MKLSELTQAELVDLIHKASAELSSRLAQPEIQRIKHQRPVIAMREPSEEDKDFMLVLKAQLQRGSYIRAQERERAAEIAEEFPEWARQQQLPTGKGTGEWRKAAQRHAAPRARER